MHGFLSSCEQAWCTDEKGRSWLGLACELEDGAVDVYCYSYQSKIRNLFYSITDVVNHFNAVIRAEEVVRRPVVVFVAHSMGGLLVRRWLVDNQAMLSANNTRIGLLLVASPSLGSRYANISVWLAQIAGNVQHRVLLRHPKNDWLDSVDSAFRNVRDDGVVQIWGRELVEELPPRPLRWLCGVPLLRRLAQPVVSVESAACYFGKSVKVPGSDHSSITRVGSSADLQHRVLSGLVAQVLAHDEPTAAIAASVSESVRGQRGIPALEFDIRCVGGESVAPQIRGFVDGDTNASVLWISGPSESGKTTLLDRAAQAGALVVDYYDARQPSVRSVLKWGAIAAKSDAVAIIDHLEDLFRPPAELGPKTLLSALNKTMAAYDRIVVAINSDWEQEMSRRLGAPLRVELAARYGPTTVSVCDLAPLDATEVWKHCDIYDIPRDVFEDDSMRRAGYLALAAAMSSGGGMVPKGLSTVTELVAAIIGRNYREAGTLEILDVVAIATEGDVRRFITDADLSREIGEASLGLIHGRIKEPLVTTRDRIHFRDDSSGLTAVATTVLRAVENRAQLPSLRHPPSGQLVRVLRELMAAKDTPSDAVLSALGGTRGQNFDNVGYTPAVLATVSLADSTPTDLNFDRMWLQGPQDVLASSVPDSVRADVLIGLEKLLHARVDELKVALLELDAHVDPCYRGGIEIWSTMREWSMGLPVPDVLDETVYSRLASMGMWRYEDILDAVVAETTTAFLRRSTIETIVGEHFVAAQEEVLADIWDGLNDGLWDSIGSPWSQLESLSVTSSTRIAGVSFRGAHLQRARFGTTTLVDVDLRDADMFLADFRSCEGLTRCRLEGANWWDAMLCPRDRYELVAMGPKDAGFDRWCETPPWTNPYYSKPWPAPFE